MEIVGLDRKLKELTKRDLMANNVPTLRDVLSESVGRKKSTSYKESRELFKLADKILDSKNENLNLDDEETQMLKSAVKENSSGYFPFYHGQVLEILDI